MHEKVNRLSYASPRQAEHRGLAVFLIALSAVALVVGWSSFLLEDILHGIRGWDFGTAKYTARRLGPPLGIGATTVGLIAATMRLRYGQPLWPALLLLVLHGLMLAVMVVAVSRML